MIPPTPVVIYEDEGWQNLLPMTYMRASFQMICGMGSLLGRVMRLAAGDVTPWCRPLLAPLVAESTGLPANTPAAGATLFLNGRGLWSQLPEGLPKGRAWVGVAGGRIVAVYADAVLASRLTPDVFLSSSRLEAAVATLPRVPVEDCVKMLDWPWNFIHAHRPAFEADWETVSPAAEKRSELDPGSYLLAPERIHIGEGTRIKPCVVIDAESGPVWIGNNVKIMPHSYIQGPAYIGDGTLLQPGAIVREGTYIGPVCKVGGELEGCILQGYSNKQHDGFLGHSYVGSWVNIAADCINSDLKNTYGTVRVPINGRAVESREQFVGCFIGDHSKIGINVSIPTGAVIGMSSSLFASVAPKFVPSFAWIEGDRRECYEAERALRVARAVMARRKKTLSEAEERVFLVSRRLAETMELVAGETAVVEA